MSEVRDNYLRAVYDLSKADPSRWATFIEAYRAFAAYEYERSLSAPTSEALVNLGMNRRMRDLGLDFVDIENLMGKLKK